MSRLRAVERFALLGAVLSLTACGLANPRGESLVADMQRAIEDGIASQAQSEPPPEAVTSALLPSMDVDTADVGEEIAERYTVSVKDSPARQFFMSLVEGTPYNVVVHPEVDGNITLDLKDVTIPQVMDIVRTVYGYEYRRTSYGFDVLPRRLQSRIYPVNYLNMNRRGSSEVRVSSGQVTEQTGAAAQDAYSTTLGQRRASRVTGTLIKTQSPETTFWTELQASIQSILGDLPGRSVVVNPEAGMVVVRAMPNELREVEEFLMTAQAIAQRQVILEAKILEIDLNEEYRQGINWAGFIDNSTIAQLGGSSLLDDDGLVPGIPPIGNGSVPGLTDPFGGIFAVNIVTHSFEAFVELLDQMGTVHVLSSPRLSTLNNQKAVIRVGNDEYFVTDVSSTTTTGTTTTTTPSIELTPFFSGVALDVTPQISADGEVLLHIHPSISRVRDQQKRIIVGDTEQVLPLAFSTVRESDTIVSARSGQVIVIGGLMEDTYENDTADTPFSAVPLAGPYSGQKRVRIRKTELVILMRPVVVEAGQQWADVMRDLDQRMERLDEERKQPGRYGQQRF